MKIRFDDCICHGKLIDHHIIHERLLNEINSSDNEPIIQKGPGYYSTVSRADYNHMNSFERSWVKKFIPSLFVSVEKILSQAGYKIEGKRGVDFIDIWFHQYLEGDTYGWHVHTHQFSGIYYLEFGKSSGKTQICSPFSFKTKKINVKEGDIVIFPSHILHRALPNKSERKTVISFNFNLTPETKLDVNLIRN